jgi:hypothetical protein
MKKQYYLLTIITFFAFVIMPVIIKAQINDTATRTPLRAIPRKVGQEILIDLKQRQDNVRANQNLRNTKLDGRASTTRTILTTFFEIRRHIIESELQKALNNLKNVSSRIQSRIDKTSSSGRDMTDAKALLVTANVKILTAQNAIDAIKNLSATSTKSLIATSTASTTVDLNRPRLVAGNAQKDIKDAQKALNNVIVAIAKVMGLRLGNDNNKDRENSISSSTATTTL